jgi:hypothetical protein
MKRMRIMGLCLVAAFAISAIGAVSASALPEIGRCVAKAGGKYADAGCKVKAAKGKGVTEWLKGGGGSKLGFSVVGGVGELETESGTKVVCQASTASGLYKETSGAIKEVQKVVARFTTCELPLLTAVCTTKGAAAGEIVTNSLKGPLGYISKAKLEIGQELTPETKKGAFTTFECGGGAVSIIVGEGKVNKGGHNCIIAPIVSVNVMSTTATETYSAETVGSKKFQKPNKFEGKTLCELESAANKGPAEFSNQTQVNSVTNEQALEILG